MGLWFPWCCIKHGHKMRINHSWWELLVVLFFSCHLCSRLSLTAAEDQLPVFALDTESDSEDIEGDVSDGLKALLEEQSFNNDLVIEDGNWTTDEYKIKESGVGQKHNVTTGKQQEKQDIGRFNETIEKQGGVLETVARVGKHSLDEEENDDEIETPIPKVTKPAKVAEAPSTETVENKVQAEENSDQEDRKISAKQEVTHDDISDHHENYEQMYQPPILPISIIKEDKSSTITANVKEGDMKNITKEKTQEQNRWRIEPDDVARLIDREDNEYVLSNPRKGSQMRLQEDMKLIYDIVVVIVASAIGGGVCGILGQPVILGYLAAGMFVGPGGFRLVHELVQVETFAQFGVVFLLFALGVEFSITKMQGVQAVALGGGCVQILMAMMIGGLVASHVPQGLFIGAFLSMSSTAVVVKCMMDANMAGTENGQIMLGTLILQDCALGLLLAVMPALASKGSSSGTIVFALAKECMLLLLFCAAAWVISKVCIPRFFGALSKLSKQSSELYQLGIVGICLSIALLSQSIGLGLEVGSFVAGLMLSGGTYSEKTLHQLEPIRNVFAALFLASIGMVMHPVFLWQHKDILLASLGVMFFGKTCLIATVVRVFGYSASTAISVGIALAQIGEFSFVLLSRAQGLGLVSRKLYLLLMGTSALSLVLTPFAFKLVIQFVPREKRSQHLSRTGYSDGEKKLGLHHGSRTYSALFKEPLSPPAVSTATNKGHNYEMSQKEKDEQVESNDLEDGWVDTVSSSQVTLRRPFSQVFSGKWKDWRNLSELPRLYGSFVHKACLIVSWDICAFDRYIWKNR